MSLVDVIAGRPLASSSGREERVGTLRGVAVFGLDALGSATYGPEAALTVLMPLGVLGLHYLLPITATIIALLLIVYVSYRQTIRAYPGGGGAFTVASKNLGPRIGLLAAAALMIDYILNVCVGISTGVGALVSAAPRLQPHTLMICLVILGLIACVNLRGTRESGALWLLPTYLFVISLLVVVACGAWKIAKAGGHPVPLVSPAISHATVQAAGLWVLLRAFASGCTALTGVEAVSNGVKLFEEPTDNTAKRTLTLIVVLLAVLLAGIAYDVRGYGIVATAPGSAQYQSVVSMLTAAVFGHGVIYYVTIASVLCVLSLSANTSFAGFPELCCTVAQSGYLPNAFQSRGRRLAHTIGILTLASIALLLLIAFGGVTDRLIPLFAIGAFLAFTFSQAGMVGHWLNSKEPHARLNALMNGLGAVVTAVTVVIVLIAKFTEGAWITTALLAIIYLLLSGIHRHYQRAARILDVNEETLELPIRAAPTVLIPIAKWNRASLEAVSFAASIGNDLRILHVSDDAAEATSRAEEWQQKLERAFGEGQPVPRVVGLCSPYRSLTPPLLEYIREVQTRTPASPIVVVIAEVIAAHWYEHLLHNYRAIGLRLRLLLQIQRRIVIVEVPWQLPPEV
jgi:amino acid transporter